MEPADYEAETVDSRIQTVALQFVKNMKASTANEPQEVMNGFKGVNSIKMIREKRQAENFRGAAGGVVFDVEGIKAGDYEWLVDELRVCKFKKVAFTGEPLGPERGASLAKTLGAHPTLTELGLDGMMITAEGFEPWTNLVATNSKLRVLRLGFNLLGYQGVQNLFPALISKMSRLRVLDLSHNGIGSASCENLAKVVAWSKYIVEFDLSYNGIGKTGADYIAAGAIQNPNSQLERLNMSGNDFGDGGSQRLVRTMLLDKMRLLQIRDCGLGPKDVLALEEVLTLNHVCKVEVEASFPNIVVKDVKAKMEINHKAQHFASCIEPLIGWYVIEDISLIRAATAGQAARST